MECRGVQPPAIFRGDLNQHGKDSAPSHSVGKMRTVMVQIIIAKSVISVLKIAKMFHVPKTVITFHTTSEEIIINLFKLYEKYAKTYFLPLFDT